MACVNPNDPFYKEILKKTGNPILAELEFDKLFSNEAIITKEQMKKELGINIPPNSHSGDTLISIRKSISSWNDKNKGIAHYRAVEILRDNLSTERQKGKSPDYREIVVKKFNVGSKAAEERVNNKDENIGQLDMFTQKSNNSLISSKSSPETLSIVKDFIKRTGIDIKSVRDIVVDGVKVDADGVAQLMQSIIQVVEGKEDTALTEEAMHFAVAIIKQKNPTLYKKLLKEINNYQIYDKVLLAYGKDPNYQTKDGKPDIAKLKEEAIGKILAETIIYKNEGSTEKPELLAKIETTWYQDIINFLKELFSKSGFDQASMTIILGKEIGTIEDIKDNNIFLQKKAEEYTAEQIAEEFKPKEKPNERKFNRPTNLPEGFRILQRTGTNEYSPIPGSEYNMGSNRTSSSTKQGDDGVSFYKGLFGRDFKTLATLYKGGHAMERETFRRYSNLRVIQSLSENLINNGIIKKIGLGEIRIVKNANGVPRNPLFTNKGIIYINEEEWENKLIENYDKGINLDEYIDLAVFEECIHLIDMKLHKFEDLPIEELNREEFNILDKFYQDKNSQQFLERRIDHPLLIRELIRMKVQKDLIGRSTEDINNTEFTNDASIASTVRKIWDFIMSLFKDKLVKTNKLTQDVKDFILNKGEFDFNSANDNDEVLGLAPIINKQEQVVNQIKNISKNIILKDDGYYIGEKKINRRVSEVIKDWYSKMREENALTQTEYEKGINALKTEKGTAGHSDIEYAFKLFVDENGYLRPTKLDDDGYTSRLNPNNRDMYELLRDNLEQRLNSFPEGTRFLAEQILYDAKRSVAGTADFIAIEPNGNVNILDWKFIALNTEKHDDIPWYKINSWNKQMGQYKQILKDNYNIKENEFKQTRMIPILAVYSEEDKKNEILPSLLRVKIGDVTVKNIKEDYLVPVGLEKERTGNEKVDALLLKLNNDYEKLSKQKVNTEEERINKKEELNSYFKAIRQLQMKQNIVPLLDGAKTLQKRIKLAIEEYNNTFKDKDQSSFDNKTLDDFSLKLMELEGATTTYETIYKDLKNLFEGNLTKEEDELLVDLRNTADDISDDKDVLKKIMQEYTTESLGGYAEAEKIVKGFTKWFGTTAKIQVEAISVLYKKASEAFTKAGYDTGAELKILGDIATNYKQWATSKGLSLKNYFDSIKKKDKNELIDQFDTTFYSEIDTASRKKDIKWIKENIDTEKYKNYLSEKRIKEYKRIEDKPENILLEDNGENQIHNEIIKTRIIKEKLKIDSLYNIATDKSLGWLLYEKIRQYPVEDKWETKEWKELHKTENAPALAFYKYIIQRNKEFESIGYIHKGVSRTFLPWARKDFIDNLMFDGKVTIGEQFLRNISTDAGDIGYGQRDPHTGEIINKIPKYLTNKLEEGEESTDLFKTMGMYNEFAIKFKYLSQIENQALMLLRLEKNKEAIETSMFGRTQHDENGVIITNPDNKENATLFKAMVDAIIYQQKYVQSQAFDQLLGKIGTLPKKINEKLGIKVFPETLDQKEISVNKMIDHLNNSFQVLTLGLNPLSSLSNLFGGKSQAYINAGKSFSKKDFISAESTFFFNKMFGENKQKLLAALEYIMPFTDNYNMKAINKLSLNKLNDEMVQEFLMGLMRNSEEAVQKTIALATLHNSVVINNTIVNSREYLKLTDEYKDFYAGSKEERKAREIKYEEDVKKLNKEFGILNTGEVNSKGEFEIPGINRDDASIIKLRMLIQGITTDALGSMTEANKRLIALQIYGKSAMVFKNWIPGLVDVRLGNIKYNSATDAYEWGRSRMVYRMITQDFYRSIDSLKSAIGGNDDKFIEQIRDLYIKKATDYKQDTGKELRLTESQFIDLVKQNIQNQMVDLLFYATITALLLGLKAIPPDDDEDPYVKNQYKFLLKATDKLKDEISYFYNPMSLLNLIKGSPFPSLQLLNNYQKVLSNFMIENYAIAIGDEKLKEKTYVIKYLMKSFKWTNQASQMLPIFYPEMAKDLGIRMQQQYGIR